ncbi:protein FAM71B-like [Setaria italica]|uniref:protein FAM71B-like n=1 Tax=Setaria italica TaxID=4555 RepID=UPI000BE4BDDE|nr:protein FAM71B-like [Setaria italica]
MNSLTLGLGLQLALPVKPLGHGGLKLPRLCLKLTDLRLKPCELLGLVVGLSGSGLELLAVAAGPLGDNLELGLRPPRILLSRLLAPLQIGGYNHQRRRYHTWLPGRTTPSNCPNAEDRAARTLARPHCIACHLPHSVASSNVNRDLCRSSWDDQRRTDPLHALGTGVVEVEAEADLDAAVKTGSTILEAAELTDGPGARAPAPVETTAGSPVGATASDAGAGASVPVAAWPSVATAETGVPTPVRASGVGTSASAAGATSAGAPRAGVPVSVATASSITAAGAGVPVSPAAAVPAVAAGAGSPSSVAAAVPVAAAGTSVPVSTAAVPSTSSASRSITSPA